ncbi:dihydrofolate reductase [Lactobacillus johnsonii]|uniref:Dihydrofolate reductase n=1 Tax=Lactobacillus johnsonii (strain FI9785) TaxID=633699 RepID=D0R3K8_LACJF|nr:dihydrofolate reductase [Lactobacillus johnsonii]CAX66671.1 dfrA [Lactobacillus johnsonii FI9785]
MIRFIWAEDEDGCIGYRGALPWHLPADLKHFKELTSNHIIVMGRKTFDSFPGLLPKRKHIILSTNPILQRRYQDNSRVKVFSQIKQLKNWIEDHTEETIDIIGGAEVFKEFKDDVDVLEKTKIHHIFKCDTWMPELKYEDFKLVNSESHRPDENNKFDYDFLEYKRI